MFPFISILKSVSTLLHTIFLLNIQTVDLLNKRRFKGGMGRKRLREESGVMRPHSTLKTKG